LESEVDLHPAKVVRSAVATFTDLPNIGPAIAKDFIFLGYKVPSDLNGVGAWRLYERLCLKSKQYQDPCVLDVFLSVEDFLTGNEPKLWWKYTSDRKKRYSGAIDEIAKSFTKS
jgi:hypothetical protein